MDRHRCLEDAWSFALKVLCDLSTLFFRLSTNLKIGCCVSNKKPFMHSFSTCILNLQAGILRVPISRNPFSSCFHPRTGNSILTNLWESKTMVTLNFDSQNLSRYGNCGKQFKQMYVVKMMIKVPHGPLFQGMIDNVHQS